MTDLFLKFLNLSISGGWLVLAVLLLRTCLRRAPKWVNPLLWAVVALHLLLPLKVESGLSLMPTAQTIPADIVYAQRPAIHSGVPAINSVVNPVIGQALAPEPAASINPVQVWLELGGWLWLLGLTAMVLYAAGSYLRLRRQVRKAAQFEKNIYISQNVASPFVLGLFRPRIYLPAGILGEQEMVYILAHEQAHIRRRDHLWKPLGFGLLSVHWFNPLMWVAYIFLCRDIELACDERVIRALGREGRADYSQALLSSAIRHRTIAACPLAFGEVGVKQRVKSVLNYKKPGFWMVLTAVLASTVLAVCFLTNPREASPLLEEGTYRVAQVVHAKTVPELMVKKISFSDETGLLHTQDPDQTDWTYRGIPEPYPLTLEEVTADSLWTEEPPTSITDARLCRMEGIRCCALFQGDNGKTYFAWGWQRDGVFHWSYIARMKPAGKALDLKKLTVEDVLELSKKGDDLTQADLKPYLVSKDGTVTDSLGSSFFTIYPMEEPFRLEYYSSRSEHTPGIFILRCDVENTGVDIRDRESLEAFLAVHNKPLEEGITNHWNLVLDLGLTTPTGTDAMVYFRTDTSAAPICLSCSENYTLQVQNADGNWIDLPTADGGQPGSSQALPCAQEGCSQIIDWTDVYGVLPAGTYRLVKTAFVKAGSNFTDQVELYAVFTLKTGSRTLTCEDVLDLADRGSPLSWSDFEDFDYCDVPSPQYPFMLCHRVYDLEGPLWLSINGSDLDKRPSSILLICADCEDTDVVLDWSSQDAMKAFMDLHLQPLAPGQENHWGITMAVESSSPNGVRIAYRGTAPEGFQFVPRGGYFLTTLTESGTWEPVPDLTGSTDYVTTSDAPFPAETIDWTERYGTLGPGVYRIWKDTDICFPDLDGRLLSFWRMSGEFSIGPGRAESLDAHAQPFNPGEIHDLTAATVTLQGTEYTVTDRESLGRLEALLSNAKREKGLPGCPFSSTIYLTRVGGDTFALQHAEDNCCAIASGGSCWTYDPGLGQNIWDILGVRSDYTEESYDQNGNLVRRSSYAWGRLIPGSTIVYTYDGENHLTKVEREKEDGTLVLRNLYSYDHWGNQFQWYNYGEDGLPQSWGVRAYNEHTLLSETTYRDGDVYREVTYRYDDLGRLAAETETILGDPAGENRYEWTDDHHYRVTRFTNAGDALGSSAYVTDGLGRIIKLEIYAMSGQLECWEEYEYPKNETRYIVRSYDRTGKLIEEGWRTPDPM